MKWSYILFLPALVNIGWALATLLLKRRPLRSQLVLSVMLLVLGFAMTVLGIFFRGRAGSLFIYFYLFELTAIFCIPLYYVGVCSLTEPRGATLPERRVMSIPLLYSVVLTAGSFLLGPRKFEQLCLAMRDGAVAYLPGESSVRKFLVGGVNPSEAKSFLHDFYVWQRRPFGLLATIHHNPALLFCGMVFNKPFA